MQLQCIGFSPNLKVNIGKRLMCRKGLAKIILARICVYLVSIIGGFFLMRYYYTSDKKISFKL